VKADVEGAKFAFKTSDDGGMTYLGAPVEADFPLSYESLAPYVAEVLDQAAPIEGAGLGIHSVQIKNGQVKVC
jgi:hypothetical protein